MLLDTIMRKMFTEMFAQRGLLRSLVILDLRKRYGASLGGWFWSVINPLLQILVYTLVFGYIIAVNVGGNEGPTNYGIFLFAGMLPWIAFAEAIQKSSTVIIENKDLVKQVRFPTILLPVQVVVSSFLHEMIALAIFITILFGVGQPPTPLALGLLLLFPLQLILTLGLSMLVAAFHVFYKDVGQLISALMLLWFFATPIIYPLSLIPEWLRQFFHLNPLTSLISAYRMALLGNEVTHLWAFVYLTGFSLAVFFIGAAAFNRLSREFADLL